LAAGDRLSPAAGVERFVKGDGLGEEGELRFGGDVAGLVDLGGL
jgi:hypothetical protein